MHPHPQPLLSALRCSAKFGATTVSVPIVEVTIINFSFNVERWSLAGRGREGDCCYPNFISGEIEYANVFYYTFYKYSLIVGSNFNG